MKTTRWEVGTFMACAYCFAFHQIDDDGQWVWSCPEERLGHERAKGAT